MFVTPNIKIEAMRTVFFFIAILVLINKQGLYYPASFRCN